MSRNLIDYLKFLFNCNFTEGTQFNIFIDLAIFTKFKPSLFLLFPVLDYFYLYRNYTGGTQFNIVMN